MGFSKAGALVFALFAVKAASQLTTDDCWINEIQARNGNNDFVEVFCYDHDNFNANLVVREVQVSGPGSNLAITYGATANFGGSVGSGFRVAFNNGATDLEAGPRDGLALLDTGSDTTGQGFSVIQYLTYRNVVNAGGNSDATIAALGSSTTFGFTQQGNSGSTSIHLTGTGCVLNAFTASSGNNPTPGTSNDGQTLQGLCYTDDGVCGGGATVCADTYAACETAAGVGVFSFDFEGKCTNDQGGVVRGDPHFVTWFGTQFDYHGECDLVAVHYPQFRENTGLDVHVRTTMQGFFSFVENVAIRVGHDVLEIDNLGHFIVNGESPVETTLESFSGLKVEHKVQPTRVMFEIHLGRGALVTVTLFHFMLNVGVTKGRNPFHGATGLFGTARKMLGRDGNTEYNIENVTEYAWDWQVGKDGADPRLFQKIRAPQYPSTCLEAKVTGRRLLRTDPALTKEAEEVCSHWGKHIDECVFDVLATGNKELAQFM